MKRGDVVVAPFPFQDRLGEKIRPALVVQHDRENRRLINTILVMITGNLSDAGQPTTVLIDPATAAGREVWPLRPFLIKCQNLATIRQARIIQVIGRPSFGYDGKVSDCLKRQPWSCRKTRSDAWPRKLFMDSVLDYDLLLPLFHFSPLKPMAASFSAIGRQVFGLSIIAPTGQTQWGRNELRCLCPNGRATVCGAIAQLGSLTLRIHERRLRLAALVGIVEDKPHIGAATEKVRCERPAVVHLIFADRIDDECRAFAHQS